MLNFSLISLSSVMISFFIVKFGNVLSNSKIKVLVLIFQTELLKFTIQLNKNNLQSQLIYFTFFNCELKYVFLFSNNNFVG